METDPDQLMVYGYVAVTLIVWALLCLASWRSLCWMRRNPAAHRMTCLSLAVFSLLFGLCGAKAQIHWTGEDDRFSIDLGWLFLLPAGLGMIALIQWFKTRKLLSSAPAVS